MRNNLGSVYDIKVTGLYITEEVYIEYFMGVNTDKVVSETYHLSRPHIIDQIVSDLGLSKSDATPRTTPDLTKNIPGKYQDVENPIKKITIAVS